MLCHSRCSHLRHGRSLPDFFLAALEAMFPTDARAMARNNSLFHELVHQCPRIQPAVNVYRDIHENSSLSGYNLSIAERSFLSIREGDCEKRRLRRTRTWVSRTFGQLAAQRERYCSL